MSGTKAGGALAAKTNKAKYGEDFYVRNGAIGGRMSRTGGFYVSKDYPTDHPAHPSTAGRKGGKASRKRGPANVRIS